MFDIAYTESGRRKWLGLACEDPAKLARYAEVLNRSNRGRGGYAATVERVELIDA